MNNDQFLTLNDEKSITAFRQNIMTKPVVLFGCGKLGENVLRFLKCCNKEVIVIDNNKNKQGKKWHGSRIKSLEDVKNLYEDAFFVIANISHYEEMANQLLSHKINWNNIVVCSESRAINEAIIKSGKYADEDKFFCFDSPIPISLRQFRKEAGDKIRCIYYKLLLNLSTPPKVQYPKKYNVSVCAIFKDEAAYLAEWIEYHKMVGVEHFYLYNNFSSDNYHEIIDPYIKNGLITLIDWPVNQGQISAYQHCFDNYSEESRWIGLIDIDEFVTPIKTDDIYSVLSKFEKNRGAVLFYWRMFTSSGIVHRDTNNLVTEDFTVCIGKYYNIGKCFINTSYSPVISKEHFLVHHEAWTTIGKRAIPPVNTSDRISFFGKRQNVSEKAFMIQINHYNLKSYEEYVKRANKGDVYFKKSHRTDAYFTKIDSLGDAEDKSAYKYLEKLKQQLKRA